MEFLAVGFLVAIITSFVCGLFCSHLAIEKGYSSGVWFAIGFFTWILGVIAAAGLPDKKLREIFRNNIPTHTPGTPSKRVKPAAPDPDTWVCGQCFRVNPNSEDECYHCQTKRKD